MCQLHINVFKTGKPSQLNGDIYWDTILNVVDVETSLRPFNSRWYRYSLVSLDLIVFCNVFLDNCVSNWLSKFCGPLVRSATKLKDHSRRSYWHEFIGKFLSY